MNHLSLFSGIGGIDLAAHWAGMETVAFCEAAEYPRKVLHKHWPDVDRNEMCPYCKNEETVVIKDVVYLAPMVEFYGDRAFVAVHCPMCEGVWSIVEGK